MKAQKKKFILQTKFIMLLLALVMVVLIPSCKKSNVDEVVQKDASFALTVNNGSFSGNQIGEESYITQTDEFIDVPYAELHLAGTDVKLDVMFANPSVKQYSFATANEEAGITLSANNTVYSPGSNAVVNITKIGSNNIAGTIAGTFKDVNGGADITITSGNFNVQF
jgi:transglutaminase/protease-like cytokinesis protein 3